MSLALFDLDNTLIGGDSDYLWGRFLAEQGHVDGAENERRHRRYYQDYLDGSLDIHEFLGFRLEVLGKYEMGTLSGWRAQFLEEKIRPIVLPKAVRLVEDHRSRGDTLLIITATNRFLTAPIAALFDVPHLIATEPEWVDGRYSGRAIAGSRRSPVGRSHDLLPGSPSTARHSRTAGATATRTTICRSCAPRPIRSRSIPTRPLAAAAHAHGWPIISLR